MNFDLESITGAGIDLKTGFDYTGGQDRYVSALQRYYKSSESNREKIGSFGNINDPYYAKTIEEQFFAPDYRNKFFYRYLAKEQVTEK